MGTSKCINPSIHDPSMASKTKSVLISVVVLRLLTLGFLAASIVLLFLDKFTLSDGTQISFKIVIAYGKQ